MTLVSILVDIEVVFEEGLLTKVRIQYDAQLRRAEQERCDKTPYLRRQFEESALIEVEPADRQQSEVTCDGNNENGRRQCPEASWYVSMEALCQLLHTISGVGRNQLRRQSSPSHWWRLPVGRHDFRRHPVEICACGGCDVM